LAAPEAPGADRRRPKKSRITYPVRAALSTWLQAEAKRAHADFGRRYRVLDVGSGIKPYAPFFEPYVESYVGVDIGNPAADLEGSAEALPVDDGSFDLVLSTQVLEHVADPNQAVREFHRVASPGGRVLASTHGVQVYHPSPTDYWRWTHAGLELMFERSADWKAVEVTPVGGAATCLAATSAVYVDLLFRKAHLKPLALGSVWTLNSLGALVDRAVPSLREPIPGSLHLNFHVVADKPR
jgi:SAM-dependent methyltransferase